MAHNEGMGKEVVQGIGFGLVAVVICVSIGVYIGLSGEHSGHGGAHGDEAGAHGSEKAGEKGDH